MNEHDIHANQNLALTSQSPLKPMAAANPLVERALAYLGDDNVDQQPQGHDAEAPPNREKLKQLYKRRENLLHAQRRVLLLVQKADVRPALDQLQELGERIDEEIAAAREELKRAKVKRERDE